MFVYYVHVFVFQHIECNKVQWAAQNPKNAAIYKLGKHFMLRNQTPSITKPVLKSFAPKTT